MRWRKETIGYPNRLHAATRPPCCCKISLSSPYAGPRPPLLHQSASQGARTLRPEKAYQPLMAWKCISAMLAGGIHCPRGCKSGACNPVHKRRVAGEPQQSERLELPVRGEAPDDLLRQVRPHTNTCLVMAE